MPWFCLSAAERLWGAGDEPSTPVSSADALGRDAFDLGSDADVEASSVDGGSQPGTSPAMDGLAPLGAYATGSLSVGDPLTIRCVNAPSGLLLAARANATLSCCNVPPMAEPRGNGQVQCRWT